MDKVKKYKELIVKEFSDYAKVKLANGPDVHKYFVQDEAQQRYILMAIGWAKDEYIHDIMFHVQIIDDKVWVHEDMTDHVIAAVIEEAGIPESDIVLGFVEPFLRKVPVQAAA